MKAPEVPLDSIIYESPPFPAMPTATCAGNLTAWELPSVKRDYAHDIIVNKNCAQMATIVVDANAPDAPLPYPTTPHQSQDNDQTLWLSVSLIRSPSCMSGFEINETACEQVFGNILDGCNANSKDKYGGSVVYGCGVYNMQTSVGEGDTPPEGRVEDVARWWSAT